MNYALDEGLVTFISEPKIVLLEHERYRRDAPAPTTVVTESSTTVAVPVSNGSSKPTQTTPTEDTNRTVNNTTSKYPPFIKCQIIEEIHHVVALLVLIFNTDIEVFFETRQF